MEEDEGDDGPPKNVQSGSTVEIEVAADAYARKLARQLDFTGGVAGSVVLQEQRQQSELRTQTQVQPPQQLQPRPSQPHTTLQNQPPMPPPHPQPPVQALPMQQVVMVPMLAQSPHPPARFR